MNVCKQVSFNCYREDKARSREHPLHIALACAHAKNFVMACLKDYPEIEDGDYSGLSDEEYNALSECLDYIATVECV